MVLCSIRIDQDKNGRMSSYHLEKTVGTEIIYTIPPTMLHELFTLHEAELKLELDCVEQNIPSNVLQKLLKIPYFISAYEEDGMLAQDFGFHPAFIRGLEEANKAYEQTVDLIVNNFNRH
jgi:transaldolase